MASIKLNKIVPCLWYHTSNGKISEVIDYYKTIFDDNFIARQINILGETPSGHTELCEVTIFKQDFLLMSTAQEHHSFNDTISFTINCDNQKEIDKYWDYFTKEGHESQCGWCIDKYGLRWQIVPKHFDKLLSKPNAWEVMMRQTKIIINEYYE